MLTGELHITHPALQQLAAQQTVPLEHDQIDNVIYSLDYYREIGSQIGIVLVQIFETQTCNSSIPFGQIAGLSVLPNLTDVFLCHMYKTPTFQRWFTRLK